MNPLLIALAVILAAYLALGVRRHPRIALTVWIVCLVAVPVWPEIRIGVSLQPLSVVAACLLPSILHHWRGKLRAGDWIMVGFAITSTIAWVLFDAPQFAFASVFTQWMAAYLVGRSLAPAAGKEWVHKALAYSGVAVGLWALLEFAFSLHVFETWFVQSDPAGWHRIQIRGDFARSEGAFGHSIAMGGYLALTAPFVIAHRTTFGRRFMMIAIVAAGALTTFSRGAIIGFAIAFVLTLIFLPSATISRGARQALIVGTTIAAIFAVPWTLSLFDSVSSDLTVSSEYRQDLAFSFIPDLNAFGLGEGVFYEGSRQLYRQFTSIDNAYALMGLELGWVPVVFLILGIIGAAIALLRRYGGPAEIALVSQAVVLATVALITQYGLAVFFIAGVAVGLRESRRASASPVVVNNLEPAASHRP